MKMALKQNKVSLIPDINSKHGEELLAYFERHADRVQSEIYEASRNFVLIFRVDKMLEVNDGKK